MDEYHFQKLTPIDYAEMGVYEKAMDFAFSQDDLRNVAVTGPYGSGKSSMIETYKKKSPYRFLTISLAHFAETDGSPLSADAISEGVADPESVLEGKILNQLLHQLDANKIEQTDFKVKRPLDERGMCKTAGLTLLFIILFLYLKNFTAWEEFLAGFTPSNLTRLLQTTTNPYAMVLGACILALLTGIFLYHAIRLQAAKNVLRKLKIEGNELEIFNDKNDSYFDRYLNEVLYLFKHTGVDAIVFEDIDRFDMTRIFERLREVNRLVNEQLYKESEERKKKKVKKNAQENTGYRPLRFFYLLRDDIFVNKDRTKFFDFIISVVPALNGSNAKDEFIGLFEKSGILGEIDRIFLRDVSLYIDEMRVLHNIYNEFRMFYAKIGFIGLDKNKLLAMVIYKNLFPKDFGDLQLRRGYVFQVFANRERYIQSLTREKQRLIEKKENRINELQEEQLESVDELDAVFMVLPNKRMIVNNTEIEMFKTRRELLHAMKGAPNQVKTYENGYYGSRWENYDFSSKYQGLLSDAEYSRRSTLLAEKAAGEDEKLRQDISRLKEEIDLFSLQKIQAFITDKELDSVVCESPTGKTNEFNEIKDDVYFPLIKYSNFPHHMVC